MKRVIVDYAKLTNEILTLLVEKFPDGYDDSDVIRFKNAKNETVEAVEVRTEDTIYLVKVSTKLADRIENYDEDDIIEDDVVVVPDEKIGALKDLDIEDDDEDDDISNDSDDIEDSEDGDDDDAEEEDDED
ncbi:DNA primase [Flavobacterium sp. UBA6195]|jgi:DNA-directed RNA polymerase subunit delta|uniref:DNA primase n=1 Tax=Flavobacterium sp. UBA6195 TaxID=1946554 RepID=UPI0025C653C1|nr:DNA primase [Flavobacterium sp. UBA6195]